MDAETKINWVRDNRQVIKELHDRQLQVGNDPERCKDLTTDMSDAEGYFNDLYEGEHGQRNPVSTADGQKIKLRIRMKNHLINAGWLTQDSANAPPINTLNISKACKDFLPGGSDNIDWTMDGVKAIFKRIADQRTKADQELILDKKDLKHIAFEPQFNPNKQIMKIVPLQ